MIAIGQQAVACLILGHEAVQNIMAGRSIYGPSLLVKEEFTTLSH